MRVHIPYTYQRRNEWQIVNDWKEILFSWNCQRLSPNELSVHKNSYLVGSHAASCWRHTQDVFERILLRLIFFKITDGIHEAEPCNWYEMSSNELTIQLVITTNPLNRNRPEFHYCARLSSDTNQWSAVSFRTGPERQLVIQVLRNPSLDLLAMNHLSSTSMG